MAVLGKNELCAPGRPTSEPGGEAQVRVGGNVSGERGTRPRQSPRRGSVAQNPPSPPRPVSWPRGSHSTPGRRVCCYQDTQDDAETRSTGRKMTHRRNSQLHILAYRLRGATGINTLTLARWLAGHRLLDPEDPRGLSAAVLCLWVAPSWRPLLSACRNHPCIPKATDWRPASTGLMFTTLN